MKETIALVMALSLIAGCSSRSSVPNEMRFKSPSNVEIIAICGDGYNKDGDINYPAIYDRILRTRTLDEDDLTRIKDYQSCVEYFENNTKYQERKYD